ncbi:MAG: hypothetical protein R6X35_12965 [Candidatus Krumholzibacteriia bacterium]
MTPPAPGPDQLTALWDRWQQQLRPLAATARPALLPHLRAVDQDQAVDVTLTLALSGFAVPVRTAASVLAAAGPAAQLEGWPAAVPPLDPDPAASRAGVAADALAALDGWVAALVQARLATLRLLQGTPPGELLPAAVPAWHEALVHPAVAAGLVPAVRATGPRLFFHDGAPAPAAVAPCVARMWDLAADEPAWDVRALLLHLAVLWIRPWPGANGRLARLLLNTLRCAAGHRWLLLAPARREAYREACGAAQAGDARPFAGLVAVAAAR